jgi:hypothetical protein
MYYNIIPILIFQLECGACWFCDFEPKLLVLIQKTVCNTVW